MNSNITIGTKKYVVGFVSVLMLISIKSAHAAIIGLDPTAATATFSQISFPVTAAVDGVNVVGTLNGWAISPEQGADNTAVFPTTAGAGIVGGTKLTFTLYDNFSSSENLGRFRLSATTDASPTVSSGATWTVLDPASYTTVNGTTVTEQLDDSILASGTNPGIETYVVTAYTSLTGITGFRLEMLTDASLPNNGPGRASGNFVLSEITVDEVVAPEPASLGMLMIGATLVGLRRRRVG